MGIGLKPKQETPEESADRTKHPSTHSQSTSKKTGSTKPSSRYEEQSTLDAHTVSNGTIMRDDGLSEDRGNNPITDLESVDDHSQ